MKKLIVLLVAMYGIAPAMAQNYLSAGDLATMGEELADNVGPNNAAILDRVFEDGRHYGAMVHRETGPGFSESHDEWADIYFVTDGRATLVTGGSITNPRMDSPGEIRGTGITGGTSRQLSKGDIVHIPATVPHYVIVREGEDITYFIVKAQ